MITKVVERTGEFEWIDVTDPSRTELEQIAQAYGLHSTSVKDCLDPEHLPKYERIVDLHFVILRSFDENCSPEGDTVQELTRKVAIFYTDKFVITIHRTVHPYMDLIKERWQKEHIKTSPAPASYVVYDIFSEVFKSYDRPIDHALNELEQLEMAVFSAPGSQPFDIEQAYYLKRKASVFKRIIRASADQVPRLMNHLQVGAPQFQDLKEQADSLFFYSDELTESINTLLNLHISFSSQRTNEASRHTNEVVRVLTVFSVFMLPLNVIAGIYGMNFKFMPELEHRLGYPMALGMMVVTEIVILLWFMKKGWLRKQKV
jgi:magnesium transporter